jgi:hypothetical protein
MTKHIFILAFATLILLPASQAQAHFLATDNQIGAVIHIDPDDDPIVGQPATFFFDIKDRQVQYAPVNCTCTVVIKEAGQVVDTEPVTSTGVDSASFTYTFPKRDVYSIDLTGQPLSSGQFQPFSLHWDIRVDRTGMGSSEPNRLLVFLGGHVAHLILIIGASVFLVVQLERERYKERKAKREKRKE